MMKNSALRFAVIAAVALTATSCTSPRKLMFCPSMTSVLDAVVATQFRAGAPAVPANALYTAKIDKVTGDCSYDKQGKKSDSSVDISFTATRPAAGDAATYTIPYFVAVTQTDRIITKESRAVTITFAAGETTAVGEDHVNSVSLVTDGNSKPYDYQILVGFQLTKEQYDYNKTTGIFQQ